MSFKCIHISDIHFRGLQRHDEYKEVFSNFFIKAKELSPDAIFVGGDIVHSKTQGISPELIDLLTWWFTSLTEIAPVHMILGNHDGLILNESRQDAISPILSALKNDKIKLYKKSGVYPCFSHQSKTMINWCVFSCFDEKNWSNVKPVENEINIACFHGGVLGSKTDTEWHMSGEVSVSFFDGYDFVFLGDIHKKQYLDSEKRIAYPGSVIQQNYGESVKKGFLFWEINSKNDYSSKFYELKNKKPFVTIEWKDTAEKTLEEIKKKPNNARLRIKSSSNISQIEIQKIHNLIKNHTKASEIVYSIESSKENINLDFKGVDNKVLNISNEKERTKFLKSYLKDVTKDELDEINKLFEISLKKVEEKQTNNNKWSINYLKFDNTFGYGKDNYINFKNLSGVVGIFGKNRSGKSSIPGTIMYALYNSSDRGSIKNQHIINNRKGDCYAEVSIDVNGDTYVIKRQTKKNESKSGKISSSTSLDVEKIVNDQIINVTEEQRRESDKIVRSLVGTSEDFLHTSFSSQGEINSFIKEKNTARKNILTKFLNLEIYDELQKTIKDEFLYIKKDLKKLSESNWSELISNCNDSITSLKKDNKSLSKKIIELRDKHLEKKLHLENIKKRSTIHQSGLTLTSVNELIEEIEKEKQSLLESINKNNEKVKDKKDVLIKISEFKSSYPIDELKESNEKILLLTDKFDKISNDLKSKREKRKSFNERIKILDDIPCDDLFPKCKFIKDANESKNDLDELKNKITAQEADYYEINNILSTFDSEAVRSKIKKYDDILNKEYRAKVDVESINNSINLTNSQLKDINKNIEKYEKIKEEILSISTVDNSKEEKTLHDEIVLANREILSLENDKEKNIVDLTVLKTELKRHVDEEKEYNVLLQKWKIYDIFNFCVSKKGIPTKLIESALPKINMEIHKILQNITSFTVELHADTSNNLDIYLDYGDSKRIIECCSGMEKMMASLAVRVALINMSILPRSDVFIIDEGFGSLDELNLASCSRFIKNLKSWFKTIIIISHVEEIKDIVDNSIVIKTSGKDSHVVFE